jgi:hypothetical protein
VNIVEITPTDVKYKLLSKPEGPTYILSKKDIALIIYKNGDHETFEASKQQAPPVSSGQSHTYSGTADTSYLGKGKNKHELRFERVTKTKNAVLFNFTQLLTSNIGLDYIHEFAHASFQVHVPVSYGYGQTSFYMDDLLFAPAGVQNYQRNQKVFDAGLGIYLNTSGQRAFTHFIGPLFRLSQFNGTYGAVVKSPLGSYYDTVESYDFTLNQTCAMLNNGFLYRITSYLNASLSFAVGVVTSRKYIKNDPNEIAKTHVNYSSRNTMVARLSFNFGYRF